MTCEYAHRTDSFSELECGITGEPCVALSEESKCIYLDDLEDLTCSQQCCQNMPD